jgi:glycosyltransferase involved in cell wall biosynthesis
MKLAFISPFPPSQVTLNEYGYHLIKSFTGKPEIENIYVLTNNLDDNSQYSRYAEKGIEIVPCWKFNSMFNFIKIGWQLRKLKPDAVILNLQFMTFGSGKIPAALGLLTPWICKLLKIPSIVILHNITETVKLDTIGMAGSKWKETLFRWIGARLTRFILKTDLLGVTISQYVDILREKYKASNVVLLPHGNFELPERKLLSEPLQTINLMAFGKFGTYKKVEVLFDACELLMKQYPSLDFRITIAGTDNPNVTGYLEGVKNKYSHLRNAVFTGYVAEEDVAGIFEESTFIIFPYTTTTGSSGILHQAGSYARAAILPKIDDLERVVDEEGYAGAYFEVENAASMAQAISSLIDNPVQRLQIEAQNYAAAKGLPMTELAQWYLCHLKSIIPVKPARSGHMPHGQLVPTVQ